MSMERCDMWCNQVMVAEVHNRLTKNQLIGAKLASPYCLYIDRIGHIAFKFDFFCLNFALLRRIQRYSIYHQQSRVEQSRARFVSASMPYLRHFRERKVKVFDLCTTHCHFVSALKHINGFFYDFLCRFQFGKYEEILEHSGYVVCGTNSQSIDTNKFIR